MIIVVTCAIPEGNGCVFLCDAGKKGEKGEEKDEETAF